MEKLRNKETGCPWDIEQTYESIVPHTIEETYEVAEAIQQRDYTSLKEELGDLLLQVVFLSQIAKEKNHFNFQDVVDAINQKLIDRHPHIFGEGKAIKTADQQTEAWEAIKAEERKEKGQDDSLLDNIPHSFPALLRAYKINKRVNKVGFAWPCLEDIEKKLNSEITELKQAIKTANETHIEDELGDILFCTTVMATFLKKNPETALRNANQKFESRFRYIEKRAKEQGKVLEEMTLAEMDVLWEQAKKS